MNRRSLIAGAAAAVFLPKLAFAQSSPGKVAARVSQVEGEIAGRRASGTPLSGNWIAERLGDGLSAAERRVSAFRLVQNVPYKLTSWKGDPDSLFTLGQGDCRHKSAALLRLLRAWKFEARPLLVPFDWKDLPIPSAVLEPLLETRGIHDSVEVVVDGKFVLIDPTWDPALASAGFPVLTDWDGYGPTPAITKKVSVAVRPGDLKAGTDIFAHFGIKWPERKRTLAFNRAFNAWTDEVRSRSPLARG